MEAALADAGMINFVLSHPALLLAASGVVSFFGALFPDQGCFMPMLSGSSPATHVISKQFGDVITLTASSASGQLWFQLQVIA